MQHMRDGRQSDLLVDAGLDHLTAVLASVDLAAEHTERPRVDLLSFLKQHGVTTLRDRQAVANALGRAQRRAAAAGSSSSINCPNIPGESPTSSSDHAALLIPGMRDLYFSPFNWCITETGHAITSNPGAYLRVAWSGGRGNIELVIDSSAASTPFMMLSYSLDGAPVQRVSVPHRNPSARLSLPCSTDDANSDAPTAAITEQLPRRRTLVVHLHASVQQFDRWGGEGHPPACSLRLASIRLPRGATSAAPIVRPRRVLGFGCSITEGVCAGFQVGTRGGDLNWNDGSATWVTTVAEHLDAEYGNVGFGRSGWTVGGNGGVPCFHKSDESDDASWRWIYSGVPRRFEGPPQSPSPPPDIVIVLHATNDGLTGADRSDVARSVASWLGEAREAFGRATHLVLCVPFGGFGGCNAPAGALAKGFESYQQRGARRDERAHLIDLGAVAREGLEGFRIVNGRYAPTPESCDGIHPTVERQSAIGAMLSSQLAQELDLDIRDHGGGAAAEPIS